ncbi:MAG: hypothetical protein ABIL49_08260 [candidate division WOR-3 bacterium]|jgi:DNA-directed RNA polymerase subunit K/omega
MDKNFKFLEKRFDWKKLNEAGFDKYEAVLIGSKYARYLFEKAKEQNLKLPTKPIFIAMDLLLKKKIQYKK